MNLMCLLYKWGCFMFFTKMIVAINSKGTVQISVVAILLFYMPHNKFCNSIWLFFKDNRTGFQDPICSALVLNDWSNVRSLALSS